MKIFDYTCSNITCSHYGKQMNNGVCPVCNIVAYDKDRPINFELTKQQVAAIVKELGSTFIDRENPLCQEVLNKMIAFLKFNELK